MDYLYLLSPEDYLSISLYQNNDSANVLWEFGFINVTLVADFNRDGIIEFNPELNDKEGKRTDLNTEEKPYVFWINDDDDDPTSETSGNDINKWNALFSIYIPDHSNGHIDGSRDLIDFFPVAINMALPEGEDTNTYWLQHDGAGVNVVYTNMRKGKVKEQGESSDYLEKIDMSNVTDIFGNWQTQGQLGDVPVHTVTTNGIEIPKEFIDSMKENKNKGVILLEGNSTTSQPLKIIVKDKNKQKVAEASLPLRIHNVADMYRQVSLRGEQRDEKSKTWGDPVEEPNVSTLKTSLDNQSTDIKALMPEVNTTKHVIYLHGFNNDEDAAFAFHNETYKRLYHSGSNALFTGIHWHGDEGIPAGPNYWDNVENAFYTADDFAALVDGISDNKTIIAHSLGNMVVGSAIQDFKMGFDKYFMLDPAVALEAYDKNVAYPKQMRHPDWDKFYFGADYDENADTETYTDQNGRRLWSVEWNTLFTDERKTLTWRNRFEDVGSSQKVVQYFSSGEEVLRPAGVGAPKSFDPVTGLFEDVWVIGWFIDEPTGFNAWNTQEKSKGTGNLAATVGGDSRAGWGFNKTCEINGNNEICYSYGNKTHSEAQSFFDSPDGALIAAPYFYPFNNPVFMNPEMIIDKTIVNKNYPKNLGYDVPALSFAAGGTSSAAFSDKQVVNMNNKMADGWPASRGGESEKEWRHSDFKDVAYRYTYKLFDDLVTKGNLNESK